MKRRPLSGKRAIITGASSGIGRELASQLARQGVSLVLVARRADKLQELAAAVAPRASVAVVAGDVSEAAIRSAALATARDRLGGLDILVNNAGISAHGRFEDGSEARLRRIMEVNFFAAAELTRGALPLLRRGSDPLVVNIGSILGRRGIPFNSDYCASKFALAGWSESIRPELARHGIGLLLVTPGTVQTEFFEYLIEKTGEPPWRKRKGIPASAVARATIAGMQRRKSEIVVGRDGRVLLALNRVAPGWLGKWLRRYG